MLRKIAAAVLLFALVACATSPLGRSQLKLFPEGELQMMGNSAYQEIKQQETISRDARINAYVSCVSRQITNEVGGQWQVTVFQGEQANAFALPGGNIGIYTGLLDVARNQDQLATVVAHEVSHVLADHANERVSNQFATQSALDVVGAVTGTDSFTKRAALAALGVGAQVGVLLPYSRAQESEADLLGLDLMAKAGFDPRASVQLWQNMQQQGGARPPEFISTHPSGGTRIQQLQERMPKALQTYQQAQNAGKRPGCG